MSVHLVHDSFSILLGKIYKHIAAKDTIKSLFKGIRIHEVEPLYGYEILEDRLCLKKTWPGR